jgi:hypothetical protein
VFHPVGIYWGIKTKKVYKIADIPELEKAYNDNNNDDRHIYNSP